MEKFTFQGNINLPVEQIDLHDWLINITENDYKSFSKAHRAFGLTKIDGVEGMINVESIGGNLLVQHYKIQERQNHLLTLYSQKSDAYLFHLVKVAVGVEWKMSVKKKDGASSVFSCEIGVAYPNKLLKIASFLVAGRYFLRKHINEERPLFAKSIEQNL